MIAKIVNDLIIVCDFIGCFALLLMLLVDKQHKDLACLITRLGFILLAAGLFFSFFFSVDANYGKSVLGVWDFPLWGLKDLGVLVLITGIYIDYKRKGIF